MKRLLGLATVLVLATGTGARAECYPPDPSNGSGHVDRTQVAPGECVVFSGTGFRPKSTIFVDDNGEPVGTAEATPKGEFSKQVCFGSDTEPGQHVLSGTGPDKGGDCEPGGGPQAMSAGGFGAMAAPVPERTRTVYATVYVLGASEVAKPGGSNEGREDGSGLPGGPGGVGGNGANNGGGLPFTGDITLIEATLGLVLLLLGAATLVAARPRHRRRSATPA